MMLIIIKNFGELLFHESLQELCYLWLEKLQCIDFKHFKEYFIQFPDTLKLAKKT